MLLQHTRDGGRLPPAEGVLEAPPKIDAALALAKKGVHILPCCWAVDGNCACPFKHTGHDIGKAPLTKRGVNDSSNSIRQVFDWWQQYPLANIAIDLGRSELLDVAPDAPEWDKRFHEWGLPETASFQSGGGEGHNHYLYRRPQDTPLININRPDEYDIQPRGYSVAPGSVHQSGRAYQWVTDFTWRDVEDLPYPPEWALEMVQQRQAEKEARGEDAGDLDVSNAIPRLDLLAAGDVALHDDGTLDRSRSLFIQGLRMAQKGATAEEIALTLAEIDRASGYEKYTYRRDARQRYDAIAKKVSSAGVRRSGLSWDEVVEAVGQNPSEHQHLDGAAGPRRRFPSPDDRGAVRKLRNRLHRGWLEAHDGDDTVVERALQCGGLYGDECDSGHISAPAEEKRRNCHQRLHPLCMGRNCRKPFYTKDGATKLDAETAPAILIVQLGYFDIGEDPFLWPELIMERVKAARQWLRKLTRRKDAPEIAQHFIDGIRLDLHQGYLTIDLLMAGPWGPGADAWVQEALSEMSGQDARVEAVRCRDAQGCIDLFGNLMSSAVIYDSPEECRALLEGLKGLKLVQPHGRMVSRKAECADDSSTPPSETVEPTGHRAVGGRPRPLCPECGGETHSAGFKTGNWQMVVGAWSKKQAWVLLEDDADPGGSPGAGYETLREDVARAMEELSW